ncbi:MAG: flavodoxin family protein [Thermodesulfobacteriota bacterium]
MKSLIIVSSQSGNTRKLAGAAAEALPGETTMVAVEQAPDHFDGIDLLAVGFWLMGGKPDPKSSELLARIKGKKLFLFATHGAAKGSAHALAAMNQARELAAGAQIVGAYSCQGQVQEKVIATASAKVPSPAWVADAPSAAGHPDERDLAELQAAIRSCC